MAFVGAVVTGLKSAAVSGVVAAGVSASITTVSSIASGDDMNTTAKKVLLSAVDGFASGFMWGGVSFGSSESCVREKQFHVWQERADDLEAWEKFPNRHQCLARFALPLSECARWNRNASHCRNLRDHWWNIRYLEPI